MSWIITGTQKNNWTPADIDTALWLDAADASTITESGGTVSQWDDKSGNALHISQSTALQQPAYTSNGLNGRNTITFDGSNDILFRDSGLSSLETVSIFTVMRYISASGEDIPMGVGATGSTGAVRSLYRTVGGATQGFAGWSIDVASSAYSTDTGGTHHIFAAWNTSLSGTGHVFIGKDGLSTAYTPSGGTLVPTVAGFSVGSLRGGLVNNYYSNISVAEIIVLSTLPEINNRQRIEGYLAHKWGLAANLPAGHPYKTAVPVP